MDLLALADFNLVARHGGFGRAARATDRPKATLSRRVAELEASLGIRLFERGSHLLRLTEEGRALYERTSALLTDVEETAAEIASGGASPRGALRISVPLLFSQIAMGTLAARFARRYPDVRLDITTEDRLVDMVEEGIDLVIRINPAPDENLVGRIFLRDRMVVVGHPELSEDSSGKCIPAVTRGSRNGPRNWTVITPAGERAVAIEPIIGMSSLVMVRDAVLAGVGIARLPLSLVAHDVAVGRLTQWGEIAGPDIELWLLYPSRRLLSARVAAFLEFFRETFPAGTPEELSAFTA